MRIENQEVIVKFKAFIDSITDESSVTVFHDTDMDGMTSGVLVKKGLGALGVEAKKLQPFSHTLKREITPNFLEILGDTTHLIVCDLAFESFPGIELLSEIKVLVIDHHPIRGKLYKTLQNFTVVKPGMYQDKYDPVKICTANIVYNLFNEVHDMSEHDWLAALGMISDATYDAEKGFVDAVLIKNGNKVAENPFDTDFSRAAKYGTYGDCSGEDDADEKVFEALDTSKDYKEVIEKLQEFKPVEKEFNKLLKAFDKKKKEVEDIIFYELRSKYTLNSPLATTIGLRRIPSNKTLFVVQEKEGLMKMSVRRQDMKVHVGDMIRECIKGFEDANGGGHRPAGGARVLKKDYEEFKKRVLEWHKVDG
ncbi:MAG: DHH family phosphoesterase [Candidatus Nanoarchaeia archaeon]